MRVGMLTGGGDCPGLNAVIRAIVQRITDEGGSCVGILEGWRGLVRDMTVPLDVRETDGIIARGGTILGASRTNPYKNPATDVPAVCACVQALGLDALVAIGGDDTLGVAFRLHKDFDLPIVGIPKTIDNDLNVTDFTFGFDTAVNIVTEAVDRLRTTAESHRRVMVVETMGRNSGWIACYAGIAVAADYILVPEVPIDLPHLVHVLEHRREGGKLYGLVVVAEGAEFPEHGIVVSDAAHDPSGNARLGGIAHLLAHRLESLTGFETRAVILGHLQRGGAPSAYDRVLATRLGLAASHLVITRRFGSLVALRGTEIVEKPLDERVGDTRTLDLRLYDEAAAFFR
jgi:ATP-dependent phosphofructokinase / diphosphate-dependent phosphofructokinase